MSGSRTGLEILASRQTEETFRSEETARPKIFGAGEGGGRGGGGTVPKPPSQLNSMSVLMESNDLGSLHSLLSSCVPSRLAIRQEVEGEGRSQYKKEAHPGSSKPRKLRAGLPAGSLWRPQPRPGQASAEE